jgi:uncharacterized membrane protein YjjP (DUF1212 family)
MTSKSEPSKSPEARPRWVGLIMAAALMPFFALFAHFGMRNLGFVLICITGVFLTVIYVNRSSALRWRFIAELISLYIIHIIVVLLLPLPQKIPGFIMIPISMADLVLVLSVLHFLKNVGKESAQ